MKISLGTTNNTKIDAVKKVFKKFYPHEMICVATVDVKSKQSQPVGVDNIIRLAKRRARICAQMIPDADYHIGIEGGIVRMKQGIFAQTWIAVLKNKRISIAAGPMLPIPAKIRKTIEKNKSLGSAIESLSQKKNIHYEGGASGYFTHGLYKRIDDIYAALMYALTPFIN